MALGTLFQGLGPKREGSQLLWVFSVFLCRRVGSTVDIFDEDIGYVALHVFFHVRDVCLSWELLVLDPALSLAQKPTVL